MELTKENIERQDFVDNEIQNLIENLNPAEIKINWNIENIAKIREAIRIVIVENLNLCNEFDFYPFIKK